MPSPRQTISFLKKRLAEVGVFPNTKHGQNFLVDLNLIDLLARAADVRKDDVVLEVGTGTGSLTTRLAKKAGAVVTVEIDAQLAQLASEHLIDTDNVVMLQQDVLHNKNTFAPIVLDTIREKLAEIPNASFKLVANLPYNVATPIISNLLLTDLNPASLTVTIQKELADRITAEPRTKDYSSLSVWIQSLCFANIIRVLPPEVFWPRPKVTSAIIQIIPDRSKRERITDLPYYHSFVRSLFFHRRKFLRGVLIAAFKGKLTKQQIDEVMSEQQLAGDARAEQLDIAQMLNLSEAITAKLGK